VKAYAGDQEAATTLVAGSVLILPSESLKLAREVEMKPGEQLIYNSGAKKISVQEVDTSLATAWKDNKMIFVNMSMKELKVLLERKFGVEIEIGDPRILLYHFDGTFRNETIFEILDIIKRTLPIQYHVEGQKIIINPSK
jgi:ferric-dicitrate binding protein FerR (iron transport regulator)